MNPMGYGLFGATFTAAGLSLCTYVWRNKLIHKQLMGTKGISEATGTITEKHTVSHQNTNANGHTTESTTYHVSYYFTAKINGEESQVYVDSATVADGHVWDRLPDSGTATVRFLEREPRRNVLQDAAKMGACNTFCLYFITCFSSIFILSGAFVGFIVPLNEGVDAAAKATGAGTYVMLISAVLVFVYRALWMKAHVVICCFSGVKWCTEFKNVTVRDLDHEYGSPSMRFSAAHEGKYLGGYAADRGKKHATLEEAQAACLADPSAGGVTKEREDAYTVRKGAELQDSPSGETSWIRKERERESI